MRKTKWKAWKDKILAAAGGAAVFFSEIRAYALPSLESIVNSGSFDAADLILTITFDIARLFGIILFIAGAAGMANCIQAKTPEQVTPKIMQLVLGAIFMALPTVLITAGFISA